MNNTKQTNPGRPGVTTRVRRHIRRWLLTQGSLRWQMSLILAVTGLSGLLCSMLLKKAGLYEMHLRYPAALAGSYAMFLFSLRLWIWYTLHKEDVHDSFAEVIVEGDLDLVDAARAGIEVGAESAGSTFSSLGDVFDIDLDDAGAALLVVLVIAVVVLVLLGAAFYLIYISPVFLTEVMVDFLLLSGFFRRVRKLQTGYWLDGAVKKTWLPFLIMAIVLSIGGAILAEVVPGAYTLGEVLQRISSEP